MTRRFLFAFLLLWLPIAAHGEDNDLVDQVEQAAQAYNTGHWEDALQRYNQLAERMPTNVEILFRLGNTQARLGHLDEAVANYQTLLTHQPDYPKAWHNLAIVRVRQAMAALTEAERFGASNEKLPSPHLLQSLEIALGDTPAPEPKTSTCPPIQKAQPLTAYTTRRVNLRNGRGLTHDKVATLDANIPLEVLKLEEGHAEVRDQEGHTGWVPLPLLRLEIENRSEH